MKTILSLLVVVSGISLNAKPKYYRVKQDTYQLKNKQKRDRSNEESLSKLPAPSQVSLTAQVLQAAQLQLIAAAYFTTINNR